VTRKNNATQRSATQRNTSVDWTEL